MKLGELVDVRSGYTLRQSVGDYSQGDTYIIHAKNLTLISNTTLPTIDIISSGHILQEGDVLLSIRGTFRAEVFPKFVGKAIAASSVMVLRSKSDKIIPEYLVVYLNSPAGQEALGGIASGGTIRSLTKAELQALLIPMPPADAQNKLVQLTKNINQQRQLTEDMQTLLQKIINSATRRTIKET